MKFEDICSLCSHFISTVFAFGSYLYSLRSTVFTIDVFINSFKTMWNQN